MVESRLPEGGPDLESWAQTFDHSWTMPEGPGPDPATEPVVMADEPQVSREQPLIWAARPEMTSTPAPAPESPPTTGLDHGYDDRVALADDEAPPVHRSGRLTRKQFRPGLAPALRSPAFLAAWGAYVVLSAADCLTTGYALTHGLRERNPLAARLYALAGPGSLWVLKAVVLGVMLVILAQTPRRIAVPVTALLAVVMAVDVGANVGAILGVH